ncbi:hypothetical protein [Infirmifilum sp.]|uniref:hypothetical protein n=1 Tax=Infirmifilum sp. TaxID=2856575 RepID=UPI003D0A2A19
MSDNSILIDLPPEGLLIRELTTTAINAIASLGDLEVFVKKNTVELKSSSREIEYSLQKAVNGLKSVLEVKEKLVWPYLHKNDKGTLSKSNIVKEIVKESKNLNTYLDLAKLFIDNLRNLLLGQPGRHLNISSAADKITLGKGNIALLQMLKVEFYETSLKYNAPYSRNIEIRVDDAWLSLLIAGLVVSYVGAPGLLGPYEFMTTPELLSRNPMEFKRFISINLSHVTRRVRMRPVLPYLFQIHILAKYAPKEVLNRLSSLFESGNNEPPITRPLSFRTHMLASYGGKEYVELSREDIILSSRILEFLDELGEKCSQQLSDFIELAYEAKNPKVVNALTYLYEAVHDAKDPAFASYYFVRVAEEIAVEKKRPPFSSLCVERIVETLTS